MEAVTIPLPTDTAPPEGEGRRPYTAPRLTIHGDVPALTHKVGTDLDMDGGGSFTPQEPDMPK
jgi:hypothetical protein